MSTSNETVSGNSQSPEEYYSTKEAQRYSQTEPIPRNWIQENDRLVAENQRILAELDAGRKREQELIEYLVAAQMCVDKLQAIRLAQKRTITELKQRPIGSARTDTRKDSVRYEDNKELASAIRIRELEREVDSLTAHVDELSAKSQSKAAAWRYIEARKDSLTAREELNETRALVDELRDQLAQAQAQNDGARREVALVTAELTATRRAQTELATRTREQIDRLMKQTRMLRRKAARETREEIKQLGLADAEDMQQAMEELRTEVGWLKYLSSVLQETCDALKQQHEETKDTETVLAQTRSELRLVRRELARSQIRAAEQQTDPSKSGDSELFSVTTDRFHSVPNPMLRLKLENAKLRKVVQTLKAKLARVQPPYQVQYQFVSGI